MSKLWLLAAFAGGAIVGGVAMKLIIQGTIKGKGDDAIDKLLPGEYAGPVKDLWNGLVDDEFSVGGTRERSIQ
jgi:hypothetical protein